MPTLYLYLAIYVVLLVGISMWLARNNTSEDFLIAGRNRKSFQIMSSKFATSVGAAWFITYTGYAYQYGFSVLSFIPGFIISYIVFAYWAVPRIYKESQALKFYTQGDFVMSKTDSPLCKKIIDLFGIGINLIWLLVSVIGGAKVINYLGALSYENALLLTSSVILVYILLSGFRAVIVTDVIQSIIILGLFGFIVTTLFSSNNILQLANVKTESIGMMSIVGFFIYGMFSLFTLPDRYQLTFSAKNIDEAKKGMTFAAIPIVIMLFLLLVIGLYVKSLSSGIDPDLVFIKFFFDYLPASFISIGAILFTAGVMSSTDTEVYNITSYLAFLKHKEGNKITQIRIYTVILMVLTTVFAFFIRDIISSTIFAAGFTLVPAVSMLYIIAGGQNKKTFLLTLWWGLIGFVIVISTIGLDPSIAIVPILSSLLGFIKIPQFRKKAIKAIN